MNFSFGTKLRLRNDGKESGSWHFIAVPKDITNTLREAYKSIKGKGVSIAIQARIGFLSRNTSMFYSKQYQTYIIPIKADIRKQLHIKDQDTIHVNIQII